MTCGALFYWGYFNIFFIFAEKIFDIIAAKIFIDGRNYIEEKFGVGIGGGVGRMLGKFRRGGAGFFQPLHKSCNGTYKYKNVRRRIFNACDFIFS